MVLGKQFHVACVLYYACCIFVDLSADLNADPLKTRDYYCVFFAGVGGWAWKHWFVAFAFLCLGPAQATVLYLRLGRSLWTLNDTLTVAAMVVGALLPIGLSNVTAIQPLCALEPTDVAGHAAYAAATARWHAFVLATYAVVLALRLDDAPVKAKGD